MKNIFILLILVSFNAFGQQPIKVEVIEKKDPLTLGREMGNAGYGGNNANRTNSTTTTNTTNVINTDTQAQAEMMARFAKQRERQGINYNGSGIYQFTKLGKTVFAKQKKLEPQAMSELSELINKQNYNYEILDINFKQGGYAVALSEIIISYNLYDQNGNMVIDEEELKQQSKNEKEDAKKELFDLKELLDLGLITQEEFDEKAVELKKIILGK